MIKGSIFNWFDKVNKTDRSANTRQLVHQDNFKKIKCLQFLVRTNHLYLFNPKL